MKLEFNGQVILMAGGTCGTGRVIAEVLAGNAPLGVVTDFTSLDSAQSTVAGAETVGELETAKAVKLADFLRAKIQPATLNPQN